MPLVWDNVAQREAIPLGHGCPFVVERGAAPVDGRLDPLLVEAAAPSTNAFLVVVWFLLRRYELLFPCSYRIIFVFLGVFLFCFTVFS